jgi:hypothetical protein
MVAAIKPDLWVNVCICRKEGYGNALKTARQLFAGEAIPQPSPALDTAS